MSDYITPFVDALLAAIGASDELPGLMGRADGGGTGDDSPWCVPWGDDALGNVVPIFAYQLVDADAWGATTSQRVRVRLSAFAPDPATANAMIGAAEARCTPQALADGGADACLDPKSKPSRTWPPHEPADDDPARARADVLLSFYVTP